MIIYKRVMHIFMLLESVLSTGHVYGLVAPLYEQGKVLADYLTGRKQRAIMAQQHSHPKSIWVRFIQCLDKLLKMKTYTV